MPNLLTILDRRHEHWVLASMLLTFHAALDASLGSAQSAALMTAHLGMFFLWQPIWQKEQQLQTRTVILIIVFVCAMVAIPSWWVVFAWLILLIAIVAGRSFSTRNERYVYMVSLAFLVLELLISCVAGLFFDMPLNADVARIFNIGLYLLPLLIFAVPSITVPQRDPFAVDFLRGIAFSLMTALMAVLSVLVTLRFEVEYPLALVASLMALGGLLLLLGWVTTPGSGSIGLMAVWEKSVLNIGTPFENWLGNVSNLAAQQADADAFLVAAVEEMNDIPWVAGVEWETAHRNGIEGERSRHHLTVESDALKVSLFTERSFSSALLIHCRLLIQVLGYFYVAKQRENEEAAEAHLRAIFETGARVTHDIKNLLQSLNTMAGSLNSAATPEQEHRGFNLLKRRLPDVARRLQLALDKLERPESTALEGLTLGDWWRRISGRLSADHVHFEDNITQPAYEIPADSFDSIVENLVENAAQKIAAGDATGVTVAVTSDNDAVTVTVSDNGQPIAEDIADRLFRGPVPSRNGLGIGLYQSGRLAAGAGGSLELVENSAGRVTFRFQLGLTQTKPQSPDQR